MKTSTLVLIIAVVVVVVIVFLGLIAFVGLLMLSSIPSNHTPTSPPYSIPTSTPYESGAMSTPTQSSTATPVSENAIEITYTMVKKSYITWTGSSGSSYDQTADAGKKFIVVEMTIENRGYEKFNTNPLYFSLTADHIKYSIDGGTYLLDDWETVDILNMGTFQGTVVFQVPESATSFSIGYDSYFNTYNIVWTET
jgi:hypothetical protein